MGIIFPTTYQNFNVDAVEERKPTWNINKENTYTLYNGDPYVIEGTGTEEYTYASEYWDGGFAYIRMRLQDSSKATSRTNVGLGGRFGGFQSIKYAMYITSGGDLGVREEGSSFTISSKHRSYQRILLGQKYNDGKPLYQTSDNGIDWITEYESTVDPYQYNIGELYPTIQWRDRFGNGIPHDMPGVYISTNEEGFGFQRHEPMETFQNLERVQMFFYDTGTVHDLQGRYQGTNAYRITEIDGDRRNYAWHYPKYLKGGKDVYKFSVRMYETTNSYGGGMSFYDSNDNLLLEFGGDNAGMYVWDGDGNEVGVFSENLNEWNLYEVYFDLPRGEYCFKGYDSQGKKYGQRCASLKQSNTNLEYVSFISTNPTFNDNRAIDNYYDALTFHTTYEKPIDQAWDNANEDADMYLGFENGTLGTGWTINDTNFGATTTYSKRGNYSVGMDESSSTAVDVAEFSPTELQGGSKPYFIGFDCFVLGRNELGDREGIGFMNSNGDWELAVTYNGSPNLGLYDGNGNNVALKGFENNSWIQNRIWFDWESGIYQIYVEMRNGSSNEIIYQDTRPLRNSVNIEKFIFRNLENTHWINDTGTTGSEFRQFWDRFKINDKNI